MAKSKQGVCVYCGQEALLTEDHVIPQCLFPGRIPNDVPIVPACPGCNGVLKSSFDSYLRDFLVIDSSSNETPIAQQLRPKFLRAFLRHQSKLMRDFINDYEILEAIDTSNNEVKHLVRSEKADGLIQIVMTMIVRGLYYFDFDSPLPSDVPIRIHRILNLDFFEQTKGELYERGGYYAPIGDGNVFECSFGFLPEDSRISIWWLTFYRSTMMMAFTGLAPEVDGQTT